MLKLVTFDLDGTIIDDEWAHSKAKTEIAYSLGITGELNLDYYVGRSNRLFWTSLLEKHAMPIQNVETLVEKQFELVAQYIREKKQAESPGLTEVLKYLKRCGCITAVASGSDVSFVDNVLGYLGILNLFDIKITKDSVSNVKPAPDIYLAAQRLAGVWGSLALGVEDSTSGCLALKKAGMMCAGYTFGGKNPQDLSMADYTIESMCGLIPIFESIRAENCVH